MEDFSKRDTGLSESLPPLKGEDVAAHEEFGADDPIVAIYRLKMLDCQLSQRQQALWEIDKHYLRINLQCFQLEQEVELTPTGIERLTKSLGILQQEDNLTSQQQRLLTILQIAPYRKERAEIKTLILEVKQKIAQISRSLPDGKLESAHHDPEAKLLLEICQMQARLGEILRNYYVDGILNADCPKEFHALFDRFAHSVEQLSFYSHPSTESNDIKI